MMIAATALFARSIRQKAHLQARQQATAGMILTTIVQACIAAFIVGFRHDLLALVGALDDTAALAARYLAMTQLTGTVSCLIDPYIIFHLQWG